MPLTSFLAKVGEEKRRRWATWLGAIHPSQLRDSTGLAPVSPVRPWHPGIGRLRRIV